MKLLRLLMRKIFVCFLLVLNIVFYSFGLAAESVIPLDHVTVDLTDKASLQRGAKLYMNYCAGCHSLSYSHYDSLAKGIGITQPNGKVAEELVNKNLILTDGTIADSILSALPAKMAKQFFGVAPPDLTLEAKVRGSNWIFTYLKSFYSDNSKIWGVNNLIFPDVAMPNILEPLQGEQVPIMKANVQGHQEISYLALIRSGSMGPSEFDRAITDIVNFLSYIAEPEQLTRIYLGYFVLGFLFIFAIVAYFLKREFWKSLH